MAPLEPLQRERWPGAVAEQPLETGPVVGFDADPGVEGEASGVAPGEHLIGHALLEQSVAHEPAEDPLPNDSLQGLDVGPGEGGGLVEADAGRRHVLSRFLLDRLIHAVQDAEMVVEVGIQAGAEAVEEGDGAEPGLGAGPRAPCPEGSPQGAEQDVEYGVGHHGIPVQEPAEPLGDREHPLPDGDSGDHMVGQVGGRIRHAPRVAGGADAPALAGEGDEEVVAAALAAGSGESVGEDTVTEILSTQPIVGLPIDSISRDLREWAQTLKSEVRLWQVRKLVNFENPLEVIYEIPDEYKPSLDTADESDTTGKYTVYDVSIADLVAAGYLSTGESLHMYYKPKGGMQQHGTAEIQPDGSLVVLGQSFSSPSYAALKVINDAGSNRKTVNGWLAWKTDSSETLADLRSKYLSEPPVL